MLCSTVRAPAAAASSCARFADLVAPHLDLAAVEHGAHLGLSLPTQMFKCARVWWWFASICAARFRSAASFARTAFSLFSSSAWWVGGRGKRGDRSTAKERRRLRVCLCEPFVGSRGKARLQQRRRAEAAGRARQLVPAAEEPPLEGLWSSGRRQAKAVSSGRRAAPVSVFRLQVQLAPVVRLAVRCVEQPLYGGGAVRRSRRDLGSEPASLGQRLLQGWRGRVRDVSGACPAEGGGASSSPLRGE